MAFLKAHPREDLLRYLDGKVDQEEKRALETHLETCAECRRYLSLVKDFNQGLGGLTEEEFTSQEPCPDSWTLVSYEAGKVDEETARHLRAHLLFCDECQEEFYALRQLRGPSWTRVVIRAAKRMLECVDLSGSGELLEPAYAGSPLRGAPESEPAELRIGDAVIDPETGESYGVCVTVEADPSLPGAKVGLEMDRPQPGWQVRLLGREDEEVASVPVATHRTTLGTKLLYGSYRVEIRKGGNPIASFVLEIRESDSS